MSNGLNNSTGWVTFYHGLKNDKFKTSKYILHIMLCMYTYIQWNISVTELFVFFSVEKFCIFMEFMLSPETELDWNEDSSTVIAIQV